MLRMLCQKGNYHYPNVKAPREHNLSLLDNLEQWAFDMQALIRMTNTTGFFRWHDSGDIQSLAHLLAIVDIAKAMPDIRFWIPTKEKGILNQFKRLGHSVPDNLVIRLSMAMINQAPNNSAWHLTSTVTDNGETYGAQCNSNKTGGKCLTCRTCWDSSVTNVNYSKH